MPPSCKDEIRVECEKRLTTLEVEGRDFRRHFDDRIDTIQLAIEDIRESRKSLVGKLWDLGQLVIAAGLGAIAAIFTTKS